MKIAVVSTNVSNLYETGFGGIESCHNFYLSLIPKYNNISFNIVNNYKDIFEIVKAKPDFVICGFKYFKTQSDIIYMSKLFDEYNINYLGNNYETLIFDSNKVKAKDMMKSINIPTAKYKIFDEEESCKKNLSDLKYPLFAKPLTTACSFGVDKNSFITSLENLENKVKNIKKIYNDKTLVEEYLPGREFTVSIIGNKNNIKIAPIELGEFSKDGYQFLTRDVKVENLENARVVKNEIIKELLVEYSKKIYEKLNIRDFGRIDYKLDNNENPNFLEINLLPGFNKGRSYFPLSFEKNFGYSYENTINKVVEAGLVRVGLI